MPVSLIATMLFGAAANVAVDGVEKGYLAECGLTRLPDVQKLRRFPVVLRQTGDVVVADVGNGMFAVAFEGDRRLWGELLTALAGGLKSGDVVPTMGEEGGTYSFIVGVTGPPGVA